MSNWAQRGAFSPELREERRQAYATMKARREVRRNAIRDDLEYAIEYKDKDGILTEVKLDAAVLQQAKKQAESYIGHRIAVTDITLKKYGHGDLQHSWDWNGAIWVQYE